MSLGFQEERAQLAPVASPIVADCLLCGRAAVARAAGDAHTHPNATQMSCYDPSCLLPGILGRRRRAHIVHYACVDAGRPLPRCLRPS